MQILEQRVINIVCRKGIACRKGTENSIAMFVTMCVTLEQIPSFANFILPRRDRQTDRQAVSPVMHAISVVPIRGIMGRYFLWRKPHPLYVSWLR